MWVETFSVILLALVVVNVVALLENSPESVVVSSSTHPKNDPIAKKIAVSVDDKTQADLFIAASKGNIADLNRCIQSNAVDINAMDLSSSFQYTPLIYASIFGNIYIIRSLLLAGADVNSVDKYGFTPLIYASIHGHLEIVRLLLTSGADFTIVNKWGSTALMEAKEDSRTEIVELLLTAGASQ